MGRIEVLEQGIGGGDLGSEDGVVGIRAPHVGRIETGRYLLRVRVEADFTVAVDIGAAGRAGRARDIDRDHHVDGQAPLALGEGVASDGGLVDAVAHGIAPLRLVDHDAHRAVHDAGDVVGRRVEAVQRNPDRQH